MLISFCIHPSTFFPFYTRFHYNSHFLRLDLLQKHDPIFNASVDFLSFSPLWITNLNYPFCIRFLFYFFFLYVASHIRYSSFVFTTKNSDAYNVVGFTIVLHVLTYNFNSYSFNTNHPTPYFISSMHTIFYSSRSLRYGVLLYYRSQVLDSINYIHYN